jgi:flagellar biosynthesis GTPase FlhF
VSAQERQKIGESELKGAIKVNFKNRENSRADQGTKLRNEQIGKTLGEKISLTPNRTVNYMGIEVSRVASQDPKLFGADLISLSPEIQFGHINSLQRVFSSYIQKVFAYDSEDANTIALYLLYYNAMHRSEKSYFRNKYDPSLLDKLDIDKIGLSDNYKNWSTSTQIILPLEISPLSKKIEIPLIELEREVDKVIETKVGGEVEKKRMIEIIKENKKEEEKIAKILNEKKVEEKIIQSSEKKVVPPPEKPTQNTAEKEPKKEEKLADPPKETKKEKVEPQPSAQAAANPSVEKSVPEKKVDEPKKEDTTEKLEQKKEEKTPPPETKKPDPEVESLKKENEALKAKEKDREEKSENVVGDKILFLRMVKYEEDGHYTNELWMVDAKNEETIYRSPYTNICGKEFHVLPNVGVVVIGFDGNRPAERIHRLVLLDQDKLTQKSVSKNEIFYRAHLIIKEDKIYTFEKVKDQVFFTRFNSDLTQDARSSEPVNTSSEVTFFKDKIFLTGKPSEADETVIRVLQKSDLKITKTIKPLERKK